jgi:type VI secretion system secreted protein VgrG
MPSPKSGTAGSAVSPAAPDPALDADDAVAGGVDQTQANPATTKAGTYDSVQVKPYIQVKPYKKDPLKKSWIEIKLIDEEKNPVPGEPYSITLPDSTVASGTLDNKGFARIEGIDPGMCQITFPQRDTEAWKKA